MKHQNHNIIILLNKIIPVLIICILTTFSGFTQVTENIEAKQFASEFFNSRLKALGLKSAVSPSQLKQLYQSVEKVNTPLSVFQHFEEGFVMVAGSNNTFKVVGYSDQSGFEPENIPPQLQTLMNYYEDSLHYINPFPSTVQMSTPVVAPLLDKYGVRLNQFRHPEVGGCPTGCVATGVTQIMKYHSIRSGKPIKGYGSYCYTDDKYGQICADFSGITYTSDELLSFHVANSMEMQFCGDPYGSIPDKDFISGLENHFHFYVGAADPEDYYIKNELEHQRPVYIELFGEPVGHAFVLDGYDSRGYYHVNFGWGGYYNGYYLLNQSEHFGASHLKFFSNIKNPRIITSTLIPVNRQDSLALVAVHNAFGGYEATKWNLSRPVFTWPGVLLMNERVIKLSINSAIPPKTAQSISPQIGNLTALKELNLMGCLNGNIPPAISNLKELKKLSIVNNTVYIAPVLHKGNLQGQLPADIGKLTRLEWLFITNGLTGTIPTSIGGLTNLRLLHFYNDTVYYGKGNLSGAIPAEIGNLTALTSLRISSQKISGEIPATVQNLAALTSLDFSDNRLSGQIPVIHLPKLTHLKLNNNAFSGIADGNSYCPSLTNIELQNNVISGKLPDYFSNFFNLTFLNLSNNKIESLPENIGNLIMLSGIVLDNNILRALPDGIALIPNLKNISAVNNKLEYVPANLGQSRSLEEVDLSVNLLKSIPPQLGYCPDLYKIALNANRFDTIPASFENLRDAVTVLLHDNELRGKIPEKLMIETKNYSRHVTLSNNNFIFDDIPDSEKLCFGVRNQKKVKLTNQVYKVQTGDTVTIDIRSLSSLSHPGNEYYWMVYPELLNAEFKDERFSDIENNPVLTLVINENTVKNKYYCKVFNPQSPSFNFTWQGLKYNAPCMYYLNSDSLSFQLASDEEIIAGRHPEEFVTSLTAISEKAISDGTVTLVPPLKIKRGFIEWEASSDGVNWEKVSETMQRADLKANVKSADSQKLVLVPVNNAFYRCVINEANCEPLRSEKLKVNALGNVLFDEVINVTEKPLTVSVDSIEVIVPQNFYDADFRLTITKMDNPPSSPDSVISGTGYDVNVSFADEFNIPLIIKLKNIDKQKVNEKDINRFQAVYFDDKNREWKPFEHNSLSLKDSNIVIVTDHLTKMKWWWYTEEYRMGYTDVYDRNNILVFYNDEHANWMNLIYGLRTSKKPWQIQNVPKMVQDITEYLPMVMKKYKTQGLEVPDGKFKVYIYNSNGNADGEIGVLGMLNGYLYISRDINTTVKLQQALAHEYMHYTQDYYISAHGGNLFWMEAHATLSDRIVWGDNDIPLAESEEFLKQGLGKTKFPFLTYLSNSWDYWDNSILRGGQKGVQEYGYLAGTFLHYMRSYRQDSKKLNPATLLKETSWFGNWRTYLAGQVNSQLDAILGEEYEEYVKYLISGENENFTVIDKKGNPYAYFKNPVNTDKFTHYRYYRFKAGEEMVKTDEMNIKVPYMAAKIVLLENLNPDTLVMVNYKRKHEFDHDHMVYYVNYDFKKEKMTFTDISDSLEFNFFLDVRNGKNIDKKFGNYGFILLINKEYIGLSSLIKDFDASFELTAIPLLNIERIAKMDIYSGNNFLQHQFQAIPDGTATSEYISIGTPKAEFLKKTTLFSDVRLIQHETTKQINNDQSYQINSKYSLLLDQGFVKGMPTMKDSTVYTQVIKHDIKSGLLEITENEKKYHVLNKYIEFVPGSDGDMVERLVYNAYLNRIDEKTKTYVLKDPVKYMQPESVTKEYRAIFGQNILLFLTSNTAETKLFVTKIDATSKTVNFNQGGSIVSQSESRYSGTNFSNPNLTVNLIIQIKED